MQIVVTGITGSGKSAVGRAVAKQLDIPYIGSGDIARKLAKEDAHTDLQLQSGAMAPEAPMRSMIKDEIESAMIQRNGYVLDGFPRSVAQLAALMNWTRNVGQPTFFQITVPRLVAIERLAGRARPDDNPDSVARKLGEFDVATAPMLECLEESDAVIEIPNAGLDPSKAVNHMLSYLR